MVRLVIRVIIASAPLWLLFVQPCLAQEHDHAHEAEVLGHHWAIPTYAAEIHLQMYVIFGGLILLHLTKLVIARLRRKPE